MNQQSQPQQPQQSQQSRRPRPWEYASAPLTDLMGTRFWDLLTATTNPQNENDMEMGEAIEEWANLPPEVREYIGVYMDAAQVRLMEEVRALGLRNAAMLRGIRSAIHAMSGGVEEPRQEPRQEPQRRERRPQQNPREQPQNGQRQPPQMVLDPTDPFAALDASKDGVVVPGAQNDGHLVDDEGNPVQMP